MDLEKMGRGANLTLQPIQTAINIKDMNKIKIHDATIDSYTPVIALDEDNNLVIEHYGAFGTGPYIRCDELLAGLKTYEPRTDADRVKFINRGRYDIQCTQGDWYIYDNEFRGSVLDEVEFGSWTEAVDALMDLEEAMPQ